MGVELRVTEATETYGMLRSTLSQLHDLLAQEMEHEVGMPFERYSILLMLTQADGGALRPSELADALPITSSGVTRLIDRLERDGVVERRACTTDGRGTFVAMTACDPPRGHLHHRRAVVTSDESAYALTRSNGTQTIVASGDESAEANREVFLFRRTEADGWKVSRYMGNKPE